MSTYIGVSEEEVCQEANAGYEPLPSVSSMVDVYITPLGIVFNKKVSIARKRDMMLLRSGIRPIHLHVHARVADVEFDSKGHLSMGESWASEQSRTHFYNGWSSRDTRLLDLEHNGRLAKLVFNN